MIKIEKNENVKFMNVSDNQVTVLINTSNDPDIVVGYLLDSNGYSVASLKWNTSDFLYIQVLGFSGINYAVNIEDQYFETGGTGTAANSTYNYPAFQNQVIKTQHNSLTHPSDWQRLPYFSICESDGTNISNLVGATAHYIRLNNTYALVMLETELLM